MLATTVMERMLAGASPPAASERVADRSVPPNVPGRSTSEVDGVASVRDGLKKALDELLARDLSGLEPAVLMVDGAEFGGSMCVVALVVTSDGTKVPVGLRLGDTENATVVRRSWPTWSTAVCATTTACWW